MEKIVVRDYQEIFEAIPDGITIHDADDGAIIDTNQQFCEMLGYTREELLELDFEALHIDEPPYTSERAEQYIQKAATEGPQTFEWRDETKAGDELPVEVHLRQTELDDEQCILAVVRDISERKERERDLERYKAYLEESNDVITVFDDSGRVKYESPAVERLLGYEQGEIVGQNGFEFIHPEDEEDVYETFSQLISEPEATATAEYRFRTADGEWCWLEARGTNHLDNDPINGIVTNNRDITERKTRDRELEYQRTVLESVIDTVPEGILVVDDNREFFTYNTQFVEMWEIPDEVVETGDDQQALESVLDKLERPDDFLESVEYFYANPDETGQNLIHLADGRIFDRYTAPAKDDETYYGRIWVFRDITERKEKERDLQRQNDRLQEFTSIVSHDLRNPLNVVDGRLELAKEDCDSEHLEQAADALDRSLTMIEDLLTLAREGVHLGEVEVVALEPVMEDCWQAVPTAEARLVTDIDRDIRADRSRLEQLLENLIRNAIDHGGTDVTITLGALDDGFYVADDGAGIPADERDLVFESDYSTAAAGTGFGLSIVKEIVDAHGWNIRVSESDSGGARFEITSVEVVDE